MRKRWRFCCTIILVRSAAMVDARQGFTRTDRKHLLTLYQNETEMVTKALDFF
jgi:hypothetical protein